MFGLLSRTFSRFAANSEASSGLPSRKSSRGFTTSYQGFSFINSDPFKAARVGVQFPPVEKSVGERFRLVPAADNEHGLPFQLHPPGQPHRLDDFFPEVLHQQRRLVA